MRPPNRTLARGVAALLLAVFLAYAPALRGGFIWDDDKYVSENKVLREAGGLGRIWGQPGATVQYYPLVFTSFWVENRLWGRNPAGYHAVNLLLHAANAILVWLILSRLAVPGAWLAAALFALHPVHVESVAWITERKNVLSGLFYLAAFAVALPLFVQGGAGEAPEAVEGREERGVRAGRLLALLALFGCALLAKSVTATLPAALLLAAYWRRGRIGVRQIGYAAPLLLLGAASGAFTAWLERQKVGAQGPDWAFSLPERLLIAGRALWFYAGKLLFPARLTFIYPRWQIDAASALQWLFPAAAALTAIALWALRRRIGRGPLVAFLFYGGTLFPALGFANFYPMLFSFVADHFQYLASIGPIALAAAGVVSLGGARRAPALLLAAVLLVACGTLTWRQCGIYQNRETLWRDTLAKNPAAWIAHNNLGVLLGKQGRSEEALPHLEAYLRARPQDPEAYCNLANALAGVERVEEAVGRYREALALDPRYANARNNLGYCLLGLGRPQEAAAEFRQAIAAHPGLAEPRIGLQRALEAARTPR